MSVNLKFSKSRYYHDFKTNKLFSKRFLLHKYYIFVDFSIKLTFKSKIASRLLNFKSSKTDDQI